ncbi:MAG: flavohemoglobin expression-modulating QEGLA motif protein [Candidatus Omnitrophota bacterium]
MTAMTPIKIEPAVFQLDRYLNEISESMDFLLEVTPVNTHKQWTAFSKSRYSREPVFQYRPLPCHLSHMIRELERFPVEKIVHPELRDILTAKRDETLAHLRMLQVRGTPEFKQCSAALYGSIDDTLFNDAVSVLGMLEEKGPPDMKTGDSLSAEEIKSRAGEQIQAYQQQMPEFRARVEVHPDIPAGLMVSNGILLIAEDIILSAGRVEALLHHEIGTHLLTYFNGRAQPLKTFASGMAGYEATQEGLAVLSEYLVDSLTPQRLRLLAARVIACREMERCERFSEIVDHLTGEYGISPFRAFMIAVRVWRGGGLHKDAVYLRGLKEILSAMPVVPDPRILWAGKIAARKMEQVRRLQQEGVLQPPAVMPLFWQREDVQKKIGVLKNGITFKSFLEVYFKESGIYENRVSG